MRIFGRNQDHRELMIRNLATSLILFETIDTTLAKGKEVKSFADRLIARSKKADLSVRRRLLGTLLDKNAVAKMMDVIVPRYKDRKSGFIKSYHLKNRLGDNSEMMRLELIDKKSVVVAEPEIKAKAKKVAPKETEKVEENAK